MKKKKQYRSDAFASIHETMESLHEIKAIDKKTMKDFDEACLLPEPKISAKKIKEIRKHEKVSQPIFAAYLNVSRNLVSDWERGVKKPGGPAIRLLSIVDKQGLDAIIQQ